ncbi:iron ABC transporter permease [uncultured Aeromicrobium sp.]|uniref:FecCD family ABC transporter permease n=1 Tax=uncultured Aeromicrobium sp. TaxID=337820 RepID=UPI0025DFD897|nr:iron ABC transporter permease [uncultured Aeromicrobium sp.]
MTAVDEMRPAPGERPRLLDLPDTVPDLPRAGRGKIIALFVVSGAGLVFAVLTSAAIGQMQIPVPEVIGALCRRAELLCGAEASTLHGDAAVWEVRLPRVVLGVLVGSALAAAGAVMQGVFGNPLADPGIIGVSSGAALGASLAIVLGLGAASSFAIPAMAFVAGILTSFLVYSMARSSGQTKVVTLILTGVAVNAVAGAGLAYLTFAATTQQREQIVFWQMGSLNGALWEQVQTVTPIVIIGLIAAVLLSTKLDLLALGDDAARHLGVDIERLRVLAIVVVSILTAAAVAFAGIIGFVGLVVPHLIRMLIGPGHRVLIPASAVGGALMLTVADMFARTAVAYAELPIGMLTALVGGPFFFYLIRRSRDRAGGWAP